MEDTTTYPVSVFNHTQNQSVPFSLYPNPSDGNFTIELKDDNFKQASVTVYDIMGKLVYGKSQIPNSKFQITLNQPKGIYLIKLQVDDAVMTKRLIVE
jgi:hypothetical protein